MDARMAIRLSAMTMLVTVGLVAVGVRPAQGATTIKRCDPSVAVAGQGDLRVEVDRKMIVVAGVVARADSDLLRKELKSVVDASGKVKGRSVCLALRIRAGGANYVTESIPSLVKVFSELSSVARFRAMWGGGGLTVVGWMYRADRAAIKGQASGSFPIDVGVVGVLEELPAPVRLRIERVSISSSRVVQIEQFHPMVANITLSTTSKSPLVVCPGSWRGKTPSTTWSSASCMNFDASTPAVLPGPENNNTHMSIAIRPVNGSVDEIDLDLRYTAVDAAFECFVGGRRDRCTLLPPRIAK